MKRSLIAFLGVVFMALVFIAGLHYLLHIGLSVFKYPLSEGDLRAVYLPLTAFFYTSQIVSQIAFMLILAWQISRAFCFWKVLKASICYAQFWYAITLMISSAGVFANIITWWYRLVFSGDRYGYYTTWPSAAAAIITLASLGSIYCAIWQTKSKRRAVIVTGIILAVTLALSVGAEELVKSRLE